MGLPLVAAGFAFIAALLTPTAAYPFEIEALGNLALLNALLVMALGAAPTVESIVFRETTALS